MLIGYQATASQRLLLIGYPFSSSFSRAWNPSAAVPGSIIGCYRRRVERQSRLLAREFRACVNRLPVAA